MNFKPIFCPACKNQLAVIGQGKLETMDDHIFGNEPAMMNKWGCTSEFCPTHNVVFWNEWGEYYLEDGYRINREKFQKIHFIDNNYAPFGTFQRKCNVEIYKKDENKEWNFGKFKIALVYRYQSNNDGDILKRRRSYELWLRCDKTGGYILYISGIRMFFFNIGSFHRAIKTYTLNSTTIKEFTDEELWRNQKQWWRVASCWYCRMVTKLISAKA